MAIVSTSFAAFVLLILGIFYLLPGRWQRHWLLLASYLFYASHSWRYVAILAAVTIANLILSRPAMLAAPRARVSLWTAVVLNLAVLALFKISDVILYSHGKAGGSFTGGGGAVEAWALPIGLSFYALQAIAYQVDVRRRQAPVLDWLELALYLSYFPKLLAGPIERARTFVPQLAQARVLDDQRFTDACALIVVGLVRKAVIADPLAAMIPPTVFTKPAEAPALTLWLVAFSFSLYNDFAGYTGIVRGVSALFGIDLVPNFSAPFFARSFTEFWNRWHMSLSFWLRDYVYMPLSRALLRRNPSLDNVANIVVPPMTAMLISGLWHGSGWHMVLWGAMHGVYLVGERIASVLRPTVPIARRPLYYRVLAAGGVYLAVLITNVFFRMDVTTGWLFLKSMVGLPAVAPDPRPLSLIAAALAIDWAQWRARDELVFLHWPLAARGVLLASAVLAILVLANADVSAPFVYQGF